MSAEEKPRRKEVLELFKKYTNKDVVGIMHEIIPPKDFVFVEDKQADAIKRKSGVWVPDTLSNTCIGMIMGVGPDVSEDYQVGQLVRYNQYCDLKIDLDHRTFIIVQEFDIKAIINQAGKTEYYGKGRYAELKEQFEVNQADKIKDVDKKKKIIKNRETLMVAKGKTVSYEGKKSHK